MRYEHNLAHLSQKLRKEFCAPKAPFVVATCGFSGNKVRDLAARWKEDAIELKPAILSIRKFCFFGLSLMLGLHVLVRCPSGD